MTAAIGCYHAGSVYLERPLLIARSRTPRGVFPLAMVKYSCERRYMYLAVGLFLLGLWA